MTVNFVWRFFRRFVWRLWSFLIPSLAAAPCTKRPDCMTAVSVPWWGSWLWMQWRGQAGVTITNIHKELSMAPAIWKPVTGPPWGVPLWFSSKCMGGHVAPWTGARPGQWSSASSARPLVRPVMCVCNPGVDSDRVIPGRHFRKTASGACGVVIGSAWRCTSAQASPSKR